LVAVFCPKNLAIAGQILLCPSQGMQPWLVRLYVSHKILQLYELLSMIFKILLLPH